jgi:hypothetical protein
LALFVELVILANRAGKLPDFGNRKLLLACSPREYPEPNTKHDKQHKQGSETELKPPPFSSISHDGDPVVLFHVT